MSRPWMPLYVADFRLDTLDLDAAEIGVYLILLMIAWKREDGALPDDMPWLKRALRGCLANFHGHAFNRIVPKLLARYFALGEDGNWRNKRLTNERQKADKLSAKQKQISDKRWSDVRENKELADANAMPLQSQSQSHSKKEPSLRSGRAPASRGTRLADDWKPSDDDCRFAAEAIGLARAVKETSKFKDYWRARAGPGSVKLDWSATWRNWIRKAAEEGKPNDEIAGENRGRNRLGGGNVIVAADRLLERIAELDRPLRSDPGGGADAAAVRLLSER